MCVFFLPFSMLCNFLLKTKHGVIENEVNRPLLSGFLFILLGIMLCLLFVLVAGV